MAPQQPVYLVDFSVYKPPEELKLNYPECQKASKKWKVGLCWVVVVGALPTAERAPRASAGARSRRAY